MPSDLPEKPAPPKKRDFLKKFEFIKKLEGDDIFISYSRSDGSAYLTGLDAALSQKGFACFTDKRGTDAGKLPSEELYEKIRNCKTLVLLATPGAKGRPDIIGTELDKFADENGTSRILWVNFDPNTMPPQIPPRWEKNLEGKSGQLEDPARLLSGEPSEGVVNYVATASDYMKSKDRLRKYRNRAIGVLLALLVAIGVAGVLAALMGMEARAKTAEADRATEKAADETLKAEEASRRAGDASGLAAREQLKAIISQLDAARAAAEAENQKRLADEATRKAEEQTRLAEEAAQRARDATERARLAQAEAARQQRIADARSEANRSENELRRRRDEASRSTEMAVSSMNKSKDVGLHLVESDTALRDSLALFPRLRDSHRLANDERPGYEVMAVALSPDARHFATIYNGEKLRVYDAADKKLVKEVACQCTNVALSTGAAYAAVLGEGGARRIDLKDDSSVPLPSASDAELIALSPGGRYFAYTVRRGESEGAHSSVSVLDVKNGGKVVHTLDRYQDTPGDMDDVPEADGSPPSKEAASCDTIQTYVNDLAFGPTGNLAAGGRFLLTQGTRTVGRVVVWRLQLIPEESDPRSPPPERDLDGAAFADREIITQDEEVKAVAPGTDQSFFATDAGVWKRRPGQSGYETVARLGYRLPQPRHANVEKLAFSPDGRRVTAYKTIEGTQGAQGDDEKLLETWDAAGHGELWSVFPERMTANLSFRPGGGQVAAVSDLVAEGKEAAVYGAADGAPADPITFEPEAEEKEVKAASQTADFVIRADDRAAVLWDVWAGKKRTLQLDGRLRGVDVAAVAPGGRFFALSGKDARGKKAFVVYGTQPGATPRVIPQDKVHEIAEHRDEEEEDFKLQQLSLSADGRRLAALYYYGETYVRVWDVERAADISPLCLIYHTGDEKKGRPVVAPNEILLSPDGRFLVETDDNRTGLLDLSQGGAAEIKGLLDDRAVTALAFSPDGRYLGVGSGDGILHVYETGRPEDEIARLRHWGTVSAVAFSDDGRLVATATDAQNRFGDRESYPLRVWHLQPDALLAEASWRFEDLRKFKRMNGR